MLVCQWHLDIVYGKQAEAVKVMRAWGAEKFDGWLAQNKKRLPIE